jgi:TetR/AcrR family transcriptional regulator, transcriptional repressor for nem operon
MKMPKTERGRLTRDRILAAAAEMMLVQGVEGTSVDRVLERSGAGKSQFYHYFEDKSELVRAVLDHRLQEDLARLGDLLERLDDWEGIRRWFAATVEMQERQGFIGGCPIGSIAAERSEVDEALRPRLVEALRTKGEYLRRGLERMKARGVLREDADPARLADFVTATLQGALLMASVQKERSALEATLEETYRHLRSFAAEPPRT